MVDDRSEARLPCSTKARHAAYCRSDLESCRPKHLAVRTSNFISDPLHLLGARPFILIYKVGRTVSICVDARGV